MKKKGLSLELLGKWIIVLIAVGIGTVLIYELIHPINRASVRDQVSRMVSGSKIPICKSYPPFQKINEFDFQVLCFARREHKCDSKENDVILNFVLSKDYFENFLKEFNYVGADNMPLVVYNKECRGFPGFRGFVVQGKEKKVLFPKGAKIKISNINDSVSLCPFVEKGIGKECEVDLECKKGLKCTETTREFSDYKKACCYNGTNWNGVECIKLKGIGEKCENTEECKTNLNCNPTTKNFTDYGKACCTDGKHWNGTNCVFMEGERCNDNFECDLGLKCNPSTDKTSKVCCPPGKKWNGSSCEIYISTKDPDMYVPKQVFLLSDENWGPVLKFVPVAIWTAEGSLHKYPLLIYHKEGNNFDADSVIDFLQQYTPKKLILIGNYPQPLLDLLVAPPPVGAGISSDKILKIGEANFINFWTSIKEIVVTDSKNYKAAQIGSIFASLKNAPLLLLNSGNLDKYKKYIDGKTVYAVGPLDSSVSTYLEHSSGELKKFSVEKLEKEYVSETGTNKMILINPNDLNIKVNEVLDTDKSGAVNELYTKTSLSAPILAAAKKEVIIQIESKNWKDVDSFINNKISSFGLNKPYITIVSSPNAIPMYVHPEDAGGSCSYAKWVEADGRIYGSKNNYKLIDYPVGRIFSLTSSGVSAYIARDLFFKQINKNRNALIAVSDKTGSSTAAEDKAYAESHFWKPDMQSEFENKYVHYGYGASNIKTGSVKKYYDKSYLILYSDHGSENGFMDLIHTLDFKNNKMYLTNPVVLDLACLTCAFEIPWAHSVKKQDLFCAQNIRRGAMVYQGAVDVSYWHCMFEETMYGIFKNGETIGEAYRKARNSEYGNIDKCPPGINFCTNIDGDPFYALIGDPTFKPKFW